MSKAKYQQNLRTIIAELKKTRAKLLWVTTIPIPGGYPQAACDVCETKPPGRTAGAAIKYYNPWALEVIRENPEMAIADMHGFVRGNPLYAEWLQTHVDIHFTQDTSCGWCTGPLPDAAAEFLGDAVQTSYGGGRGGAAFPAPQAQAKAQARPQIAAARAPTTAAQVGSADWKAAHSHWTPAPGTGHQFDD